MYMGLFSGFNLIENTVLASLKLQHDLRIELPNQYESLEAGITEGWQTEFFHQSSLSSSLTYIL